MSNLENAFFHLTHFPLFDRKHVVMALTANYSEMPSTYQRGIQNIYAEAEEVSDSQLCRDLRGYFGECAATYLKTSAMTGYDWHIDVERKTCINVVLVQPPGAHTLHKINVNRLTYKLRLCDYELFRPTVFNATIPHCVINPADQDRYILTISVGKLPKFDDLKDWLINYKINSY